MLQSTRGSCRPSTSKGGVWAKCDMLYTFSTRRLDRMAVGKRPDGTFLFMYARVTSNDLGRIRSAIQIAIGLRNP